MTGSSGPVAGEVAVDAEEGRRFYYGWVVVGAAVLVFVGFIGTLLSFGVFLKPLESHFGWSRGAISGAMSLCIGIQGIVGIIMGRVTDKYNMAFVVATGALVGAGSYLFLSRMESLWQFYLGFGVGAGICSGCAFTPITATVSKWFDERRRTLALGITMTGVVIGQMVLSPVLDHVIQGRDWRLAYLVAAIVVFACGMPGILIMSKRAPRLDGAPSGSGASPEAIKPEHIRSYTVLEAAKTPPFWMLVITAFAISCGFYIMVSQIVAHARDVSLEAGTAALILTFSGVGSLSGSLLAWWFARKLGGQRTLVVLLLVSSVTMFLFTVTGSAWSFFCVALIYGFAYGAVAPVRMSLIPPLFGLKSIGTMLGCTTFAWSIGGLVGPAVAGYVHDATSVAGVPGSGSYVLAFVASGVVYILGALAAWFWGSHKGEQRA